MALNSIYMLLNSKFISWTDCSLSSKLTYATISHIHFDVNYVVQNKHVPNKILDPPSPLTNHYSPVFVISVNGTTIHPVTQAKSLIIILSIKCICESDSFYFNLESLHFSSSTAATLVRPPSLLSSYITTSSSF